MGRESITIAMKIIFEQRYQSLKGSSSFMSRFSGGRSLRSYVLSNYLASLFSYTMFSLVISFIKIYRAGSAGIGTLEVLLYFYVLVANIFNSIMYMDLLLTGRILTPLSSLPIEHPERSIHISYLAYYGSSSLFVVLPFLTMDYLRTGNFLFFISGTVWLFMYVMIGYVVGLIIFHAILPMRSPDHPSALKSAGTVLKIVGMVAMFSLFELWIYSPSLIPASLAVSSANPFVLLAPAINITFLLGAGWSPSFLISTLYAGAVYIALIVIGMIAVSGRIYIKLIEGVSGSEKRRRNNHYVNIRTNHATFLKDVRIILRKTQYGVLLFLPLMFAVPFTVPVVIESSISGDYNVLGVFYSLMTLPVLCASIYSILPLISEGGAISQLFSLPDFERFTLRNKFLVGIMFYSSIMIPTSVFILLFGKYSIEDYLLLPLNLVFAFAFSYMNLLRRNLRKINPYITTVNVDTFGGSAGLLVSFAAALAMIVIPAVAGAVISFSAFGNFSGSVVLAIDLAIYSLLLAMRILLDFLHGRYRRFIRSM